MLNTDTLSSTAIDPDTWSDLWTDIKSPLVIDSTPEQKPQSPQEWWHEKQNHNVGTSTSNLPDALLKATTPEDKRSAAMLGATAVGSLALAATLEYPSSLTLDNLDGTYVVGNHNISDFAVNSMRSLVLGGVLVAQSAKSKARGIAAKLVNATSLLAYAKLGEHTYETVEQLIHEPTSIYHISKPSSERSAAIRSMIGNQTLAVCAAAAAYRTKLKREVGEHSLVDFVVSTAHNTITNLHPAIEAAATHWEGKRTHILSEKMRTDAEKEAHGEDIHEGCGHNHEKGPFNWVATKLFGEHEHGAHTHNHNHQHEHGAAEAQGSKLRKSKRRKLLAAGTGLLFAATGAFGFSSQKDTEDTSRGLPVQIHELNTAEISFAGRESGAKAPDQAPAKLHNEQYASKVPVAEEDVPELIYTVVPQFDQSTDRDGFLNGTLTQTAASLLKSYGLEQSAANIELIIPALVADNPSISDPNKIDSGMLLLTSGTATSARLAQLG